MQTTTLAIASTALTLAAAGAAWFLGFVPRRQMFTLTTEGDHGMRRGDVVRLRSTDGCEADFVVRRATSGELAVSLPSPAEKLTRPAVRRAVAE